MQVLDKVLVTASPSPHQHSSPRQAEILPEKRSVRRAKWSHPLAASVHIAALGRRAAASAPPWKSAPTLPR